MAEKRKKRKDGRYAKQVTIGIKDGKPVRKTLYGETLKELDKNYRDFMSLKDKGIILQEENITFRELSELWLTNEKIGSITDQSVTVIRSELRTINSYIGEIKAKSLRQSHIEAFRAAMIASGKLIRYNTCLGRIRAIVRYAVYKEIMVGDITAGMKDIRNARKAKKRALTLSERQLIDKADLNAFERCFINLLLYTGMRKCEALALNVSDIDFKKKRIEVSKTLVTSKKLSDCLQDYTKTTAGKRYIPIPNVLLNILLEYTAEKSGILFKSNTDNYIGLGSFNGRWNKILMKLQAVSKTPLSNDITAHIFRHTYASDLYKAGVDIKQAQYLLGHDDIKTTMDTYTHFGYADVKMDKLDSYYDAVKMQSSDKIIALKHA
ncbi:tyrosine-type recombinase/integrase [Lacrimispora xylanolytica]|uniref:Site-specific integrase n=1 Tax=Lacrimispora xylanolytica TaxID=29375 RepID=A0ABY7ABF0_9FIRM|nr:site-specific integrase [Lacrimispora xylanolytica]WAJ24015.1 site-specific integrase [Lacrimispora xylanolytica]